MAGCAGETANLIDSREGSVPACHMRKVISMGFITRLFTITSCVLFASVACRARGAAPVQFGGAPDHSRIGQGRDAGHDLRPGGAAPPRSRPLGRPGGLPAPRA